MTEQYLIGELSVRLGLLEAAAAPGAARDVACLRHQVEDGLVAELRTATVRALTLADRSCWESLSHGDTAAFTQQAEISADLRQFGVCAGLLDDS